MKPKLVIVLGFLIAVGVILYAAVGRRSGGGGARPTPGAADPRTGPAADPAAPQAVDVQITLEYSTEKKDWLEAAIGEFQRANPRIGVKLIGKGSLESAGRGVSGGASPTGEARPVTITAITVPMPVMAMSAVRGNGGSLDGAFNQALHARHFRAPSRMSE